MMQEHMLPTGSPAVIRLPQCDADQDEAFLILGEQAPALHGVNLKADIGSPCAGIILLGAVDPAELAFALERAPDPAVPIADFGGNHELRRDFVGSQFDQNVVDELRQIFAPIRLRLSVIPFKPKRGGRAELNILRLAYSRDTSITATFDPHSRRLVEYPLLGKEVGHKRNLETLAHLDLLHRRHFTRTHACGKCESARLNVCEACPACGGADLKEEPLLHHYRCGYQERESHFRQDRQLICPKCHRSLRHLGVDYGKPGTAVVCAACGAVNSEPFVHFVCLDCGATTSGDEAKATDWHHYDLTDEGVRALQQGVLPQFDLGPLLENRTRAFSPREFRLLATQELKVAARFNRPFSVARISMRNLDELVRQHGAVAANADFQHVIDAIVAALRSCDFVSTGSTPQSCVIGFPGTSAKDIEIIMARIRLSLDGTLAFRIEFDVEVAEGAATIDLLAGN
jgi:TackOD1 domain-containing protein